MVSVEGLREFLWFVGRKNGGAGREEAFFFFFFNAGIGVDFGGFCFWFYRENCIYNLKCLLSCGSNKGLGSFFMRR